MNDNVLSDAKPFNSDFYSRYGFTKTTKQPDKRQEGRSISDESFVDNTAMSGYVITYNMVLPDGSKFSFDNYHLSKEPYESALKSVVSTRLVDAFQDCAGIYVDQMAQNARLERRR